MEITKEDFNSFEIVRKSGKTNMFDVYSVSRLSGLSRAKISFIMKHYFILSKKYEGEIKNG